MARLRIKGFTLLETVAVLVIASVIFTVGANRFGLFSSDLPVAQKTVLNALFNARQIAMARASQTNVVTFIATSSSVDVRENNRSVQLGAINYPLTLPSGVTVRTGLGTLRFDKRGNTTASRITLGTSNASASITIDASGYAYE